MEKKKQVDPNACRCCGKMGHWAWECPNRKQEKKADDEDEATILMAMFCALHDVEAEEKEEVTMVEGPRKALVDRILSAVHRGVSCDGRFVGGVRVIRN